MRPVYFIIKSSNHQIIKLVTLLVLFIPAIVLKAQNSAVTNAILYQRDANLIKAKQNIDLAAENEKTKSQAKTWYYKGLIYSDIYKSDKVEVKELTLDPLKTSTESLLKAKELENNPTGEYSKLSNNQLEENWVNLMNRGSAYFQTKKYQDALDMFSLAQQVKPADTTAYVYGTYAAEGLKRNDLMQEYSNKLLSMNYKSLYVYSNVITAALNQKEYTKALTLSEKALSDFPGDKIILQMRTLAYTESGQLDEGIEKLKSDLKTKPYDVELLTNLAVLYNYKNDQDKEMEVYNKIIAIEPHNFFANYNAAIINQEKGNELARKNDAPGANAFYKKALENAKRAKALASDDKDIENLTKFIDNLNKIINAK
jgi:tetratricopeptide (TPR) repeat protein